MPFPKRAATEGGVSKKGTWNIALSQNTENSGWRQWATRLVESVNLPIVANCFQLFAQADDQVEILPRF
jgi:hypothetical protein